MCWFQICRPRRVERKSQKCFPHQFSLSNRIKTREVKADTIFNDIAHRLKVHVLVSFATLKSFSFFWLEQFVFGSIRNHRFYLFCLQFSLRPRSFKRLCADFILQSTRAQILNGSTEARSLIIYLVFFISEPLTPYKPKFWLKSWQRLLNDLHHVHPNLCFFFVFFAALPLVFHSVLTLFRPFKQREW